MLYVSSLSKSQWGERGISLPLSCCLSHVVLSPAYMRMFPQRLAELANQYPEIYESQETPTSVDWLDQVNSSPTFRGLMLPDTPYSSLLDRLVKLPS